MKKILSTKTKESNDTHWMSVSDLMSGLMMVFLFIAIAYMYHMHRIAQNYVNTKKEIYKALFEEFKDDLKKETWNASIEPETLTITFNAPQVQFERNSADLKESYKKVLNDFFPRYLKVLLKFKNDVEEIRIEGHTSSIWNSNVSKITAYFKNMTLSQNRTRTVLEYIYQLPSIAPYQLWLKKHIAAIGFSSAHVIKNKEGKENYKASRRVSFRILTNAEASIKEILASKK